MDRFLKNSMLAATLAVAGALAMAQDAPAPRPDSKIEMDVVRALDGSKALAHDLITAATVGGEVTLSGSVASDAERELAGSLAGAVNGVVKVSNNLKVGATQPADDPNAQQMAADAEPDQPMPPAEGPQSAQPYAVPAGQQPPPPPAPNAPRPAYAPQYAGQAPPPPPVSPYPVATGPVTLAPGTLLQLRTSEPVNTKNAREGSPVQFTIIRDVVSSGALAIPRGATVHGVVTEVKKSGQLSGSPEIGLRLVSLDLGGKSYPLDTDVFNVKGPNKAGTAVRNGLTGAIFGAIIGGAAGGGAGAAIGAAAGGGVGTAATAAWGGPDVWIPAEAQVDFHLNTPLTVDPVNQQEALRLAQGLYPGGPRLYRRGPYGYDRPVVYYAYPPVYYRPYYMVGGAYYWR